MPNNYQNGKIYSIRCHEDPSLIYVGSTTQPLYKRWGEHKSNSKKKVNILLYSAINNNFDKWYIELYELCPCNSKEELCKREGEVIREISTLNKQIAGRTMKEWYNDNKLSVIQNTKNYYNNNKHLISIKFKNYYNLNKEKIIEYYKIWYLKNKEKYPDKLKEDYWRNRDFLLNKNKEIIKCECGCEIVKSSLSRHKKSKKHNDFILKQIRHQIVV